MKITTGERHSSISASVWDDAASRAHEVGQGTASERLYGAAHEQRRSEQLHEP